MSYTLVKWQDPGSGLTWWLHKDDPRVKAQESLEITRRLDVLERVVDDLLSNENDRARTLSEILKKRDFQHQQVMDKLRAIMDEVDGACHCTEDCDCGCDGKLCACHSKREDDDY